MVSVVACHDRRIAEVFGALSRELLAPVAERQAHLAAVNVRAGLRDIVINLASRRSETEQPQLVYHLDRDQRHAAVVALLRQRPLDQRGLQLRVERDRLEE